LQVYLGIHDSVSSVVQGIGLFIATVVGDPLNDFLLVVAAGEGAFGVSPILFGLAFVVGVHFPLALSVVA
jgi:hypothetical protein